MQLHQARVLHLIHYLCLVLTGTKLYIRIGRVFSSEVQKSSQVPQHVPQQCFGKYCPPFTSIGGPKGRTSTHQK
jgi:hypothetical protein